MCVCVSIGVIRCCIVFIQFTSVWDKKHIKISVMNIVGMLICVLYFRVASTCIIVWWSERCLIVIVFFLILGIVWYCCDVVFIIVVILPERCR